VTDRDSDPDLVRTLRELGTRPVPERDPVHAQYRREHVTRAVGRALARVRVARGPRRRALVWASAASLGLLLGGAGFSALSHFRGADAPVVAVPNGMVVAARTVVGTATVSGSTAARAAAVGDVFHGGEVVTTAADSRLGVGLEAGTAVLGESSRLEFVPLSADERRMRLRTGTVDVDLPVKLADGRRLVVETPNVEVIVVGTAFSVGVREAGGAVATRVTVRRGIVKVVEGGKQRAVLVAGQEWESPLPSAAEPPASTKAPVSGPRLSTGARPPEGTLAEENRLFQSGLSARNAGDPAAAAEAFATLLARYPRSVLAEQALAERFRALERAGRLSSAVVTARRYLASYPRGFARTEAERLTQGPLDER
jgi:hypothetical protein